jgi:hypothetical protein
MVLTTVRMARDLVADSVAAGMRTCVSVKKWQLTRECVRFSFALLPCCVLKDEVPAKLIEIGMNSTATIIGLLAVEGALVEARRENETRSRWKRGRKKRTSGGRTALCRCRWRWRASVLIAGVIVVVAATIAIILVVAVAAVVIRVAEVSDGSERREVIGNDDAGIECK